MELSRRNRQFYLVASSRRMRGNQYPDNNDRIGLADASGRAPLWHNHILWRQRLRIRYGKRISLHRVADRPPNLDVVFGLLNGTWNAFPV